MNRLRKLQYYSRLDSLIEYWLFELKSTLSMNQIKAQIRQESDFLTTVRSPVGAKGLMQIMPATFKDIGNEIGPLPTNNNSPLEENIRRGIYYISFLYGKFSEIPDDFERWKFALASYNGGRGYVNKALSLARKAEKLPEGYHAWVKAGRPEGEWQTWELSSIFLMSKACVVRSRRPDFKQILDYVKRIEVNLEYFNSGGEE